MSAHQHGIGWLNRPGTVGQSWSPMVGCNRVSDGCRHCYAEVMASRIANAAAARLRRGEAITATQRAYMGAVRWTGVTAGEGKALPSWSGKVQLVPELLAKPLGWRTPRTVFPSMTDPFHDSLSDTDIAAMFGVMAATPQHTYLLLTKRPERAMRWFEWIRQQGEELQTAVGDKPAGVGSASAACALYAEGRPAQSPAALEGAIRLPGSAFHRPWPLQNVWLGTSVEDEETLRRVRFLVDCPAAVRFISYEPALAPVDLTFIEELPPSPPYGPGVWLNCLTGHVIGPDDLTDRRVHWVIAGGESGPRARPPHPDWFRSVRDQCSAAGVPFFFKQWGQWAPDWTFPPPSVPPCRVVLRNGRSCVDDRASCEALARELGHEWSHYHPHTMYRVGKRSAGALLDGREHFEWPEAAS